MGSGVLEAELGPITRGLRTGHPIGAGGGANKRKRTSTGTSDLTGFDAMQSAWKELEEAMGSVQRGLAEREAAAVGREQHLVQREGQCRRLEAELAERSVALQQRERAVAQKDIALATLLRQLHSEQQQQQHSRSSTQDRMFGWPPQLEPPEAGPLVEDHSGDAETVSRTRSPPAAADVGCCGASGPRDGAATAQGRAQDCSDRDLHPEQLQSAAAADGWRRLMGHPQAGSLAPFGPASLAALAAKAATRNGALKGVPASSLYGTLNSNFSSSSGVRFGSRGASPQPAPTTAPLSRHSSSPREQSLLSHLPQLQRTAPAISPQPLAPLQLPGSCCGGAPAATPGACGRSAPAAGCSPAAVAAAPSSGSGGKCCAPEAACGGGREAATKPAVGCCGSYGDGSRVWECWNPTGELCIYNPSDERCLARLADAAVADHDPNPPSREDVRAAAAAVGAKMAKAEPVWQNRRGPIKADAGPQDPDPEAGRVLRFSKALDYKSCDHILCLTKDMARHLLPIVPAACVSSNSSCQLPVEVEDAAGRSWPMTYRCVPHRYSYEFRAGWKAFVSAWAVGVGDTVTLERHTADRSRLRIRVQQPGDVAAARHSAKPATAPAAAAPAVAPASALASAPAPQGSFIAGSCGPRQSSSGNGLLELQLLAAVKQAAEHEALDA